MPKALKTFASFQAARAVAALLVVFYHCFVIFDQPKYWNCSWNKYLIFGDSGVGFFFVLSGIVILNAHWADRGHPEALRTYVWKRFRRIYPIYWIVLAAVMIVFQSAPSFGTGVERKPSVIISSIFLVHIFENNTVLTVAWTLYHEMMFYVAFAFVIVHRVFGFILLGLWMCCSIYALVLPPADPVLSAYFSPLHLLFGFGMIAMLIVRSRTVPAPRLLLLLGTVGFIATGVCEDLAGAPLPMAIVWYGLTATLCALGLMELERTGKIAVPRIVAFLGNASYSIYLVHFPALSVIAKFTYPLWLRAKVPLIFPFTVLAVGSVALGVLVHLLIERPLLNLFSRPQIPIILANTGRRSRPYSLPLVPR